MNHQTLLHGRCPKAAPNRIIAGGIAISVCFGFISTVAHAQTEAADEEVIVTAGFSPLPAQKVGSSVSVVTAEQLRAQGTRYLADAMRHVPGIAVNRTGSFGGPAQLRVRGAEGNHVLVRIDGVEVPSASSMEFDFSKLLVHGVERVEVLRGPQSGIYGANANAGVINIITQGGVGTSGIDFSLEAGSFGTRDVGFGVSGAGDGARGSINFGYRETDGFDESINDDLAPQGDKESDENLQLTGRGSLALSQVLTIDGSFRVNDKQTGLDGFDFSGGPLQGLAVDDASIADTREQQLAASATWSLRDGDLATRLSGWAFDADFGGTFPMTTGREQIAARTTVALASGSAISHFLTGFLDAEKESFRQGSGTELDRVTNGLGLEYRAEIGGRAFFSSAIRHDDNEVIRDSTTYRLTMAYLFRDDIRLHASAGTGVTNPSFFEQFGFVAGLYEGNPDLRPEENEGWDIGIEHQLADGRMKIDVTYFDTQFNNAITGAGTTSVNLDGVSDRDGLEVSVSADSGGNTTLSASFTYTNARDPDGTRSVRRPTRSASFDLTHRTQGGKGMIHAGVVYNGDMLDSDFRNYFNNGFMPEKSSLANYTLVRLGGYVDVAEGLQLFARIDNALDREYLENLSYATPGRSAAVGFRYSLDWD